MQYAPHLIHPHGSFQPQFRNQQDSRFFPFFPFVLGGLAGLAAAPLFYRPPYYYPPYPAPYPMPYPAYQPYGSYYGTGGYPIQETINIYPNR